MIWEFEQNFELSDQCKELEGLYDIIHNTSSCRVLPGIYIPQPLYCHPAIQNQHTCLFMQVD